MIQGYLPPKRKKAKTLLEAVQILKVTGLDGLRCAGHPDCAACPRYLCPGCKMWRPWCFGAGDDMPDHCDNCWAKAHKNDKEPS
jgi:hypothetical protein